MSEETGDNESLSRDHSIYRADYSKVNRGKIKEKDNFTRIMNLSCDMVDPLIQSPTPMKSQIFDIDSSNSPNKFEKFPSTSKHEQNQQPPQSYKKQSSPEGLKLLPGIDLKSKNSLEPFRMLNDTVVEFYMNYVLRNNVSEERRGQVHVFSTFFYNKIKKLSEPKLAESVRRWDRHVKLFDKDYLFIPICDFHHWTLVIVCFPKQAPAHDDPIVINQNFDSEHSPKGCMIILDSLFGRYLRKFTDPVRNFLHSRWSFEKPNEEMRNFQDRNAFREFYAKVPKQKNTYDCGIYLLNYYEKFISNPLHSYFKIRACKDLTMDWAVDPRRKRESIKQLLYDKRDQTSPPERI